MIKVGDRITTIIAPLRTGEAGGLLKEVTARRRPQIR